MPGKMPWARRRTHQGGGLLRFDATKTVQFRRRTPSAIGVLGLAMVLIRRI